MAQSDHQSRNEPGPPFLPVVDGDVVELFQAHPPTTDESFRRMQRDNAALAHFLLERAQQLAPGETNVRNKEAVARLAIEIYALLVNQGEVDALNASFAHIAPNGSAA